MRDAEGDRERMARAAALGYAVRRRTPPNPWVGCVLVRDAQIVGEGATEPPGGRHAEVQALDAAGERARGATAYVTLEPCAHHGRTPPCADALVRAGVARVVVAVRDPDPDVAGRGIERLQAAGVEIEVGPGTDLVADQLAAYLHHRRAGRAYCVLKTATSLDGRVTAADGSSRWITGPAARADAHALRADSQAVVIGSGTALADRPTLTARPAGGAPVTHQPLRVLLDGRGRVPASGPLFEPAVAPTLVLTTQAAPAAAMDAWRSAGAKVEVLPAADTGGVDLCAALTFLGAEGVLQAMVEGGPTVHGALLAAGLVDRVVAYVAGVVLGPGGHPGFDAALPTTLADAPRLRLLAARPLGDDVRLDYVPAGERLMFTGIVEELGSVRAIERDGVAARLEISCSTVLADAVIGASIAVNGCCLTVVELDEGWWAAVAQPETLARTTLGTLVVGAPVNLERPVRLADRLGGHLVQGHVDGVGRVVERVASPDGSVRVGVEVPDDLARYVVEKGSITIDGVSLTVTEIADESLHRPEPARVGVALIPHTLAHTTLGVRGPGDPVNLEVDVLAKYVERLMVPLDRGVVEGALMPFTKIENAIAAIERGELVIVVDDADRENEGDLIMAAEMVTPESIAFMIRHTSGVICQPLEGDRCDALSLPLMVAHNTETQRTAFTVSVDARVGTTTGISAADRAATVRALIDPQTRPDDLARPGHIFPLRYREGGVLKRAGHTEAAVDLARLAGMNPSGVLAEVTNDDGTMARLPELERFAAEHSLQLISIADLIRFRRHREKLVRRVSEARIPTRHGDFTAYVFESLLDGVEHLAFVRGEVAGTDDVLVRVHSECLTGDVFGSMRCDCGVQLDSALERVAHEGRGVVVYLRGHEGRGIGLGHKMRAYSLQDEGRDTVEANVELGFPPDSREYGIGSQILVDLGVTTMRLMTNNPSKYGGLEGYGLEIVERVPLHVAPNHENISYLRAKQEKLGHLLDLGEAQV